MPPRSSAKPKMSIVQSEDQPEATPAHGVSVEMITGYRRTATVPIPLVGGKTIDVEVTYKPHYHTGHFERALTAVIAEARERGDDALNVDGHVQLTALLHAVDGWNLTAGSDADGNPIPYPFTRENLVDDLGFDFIRALWAGIRQDMGAVAAPAETPPVPA